MIEVPVYVVANIVIQDPDTYKKYEKGFFPILKKYEGSSLLLTIILVNLKEVLKFLAGL